MLELLLQLEVPIHGAACCPMCGRIAKNHRFDCKLKAAIESLQKTPAPTNDVIEIPFDRQTLRIRGYLVGVTRDPKDEVICTFHLLGDPQDALQLV